MWQQSENISTLLWEHGKITLCPERRLPAPESNSILITTDPFTSLPEYSQELRPWGERLIWVAAGQDHKNMLGIDRICKRMVQLGVNRQTTVYVLGGGMLLDMAGFATSIYMRGVKNVIYVPTTLLAIVDATVGGKTGVNWAGAKNMIGTIRHCKQIQISLHYLKTLPLRHWRNGLAECIKMSITHNKSLFQRLQDPSISLQALTQQTHTLRDIVKQSLQIKTQVVQGDQFDYGSRQWLNFGHTLAHALELSQHGHRYYHGEWVAIGMMEELKIAQKLGLIDNPSMLTEIEGVLNKFNLPTQIPTDIPPQSFLPLTSLDKKSTAHNQVQLALVKGIGERLPSLSPVSIQSLYSCYMPKEFVWISAQALPLQTLRANVQRVNQQWLEQGKFPGSKSLSIRYLFLSALQFLSKRQPITLRNYLEADDTICLKGSLQSMGFIFEHQPHLKTIRVIGYEPKTSGQLQVGNSGLTARFVALLCAYLPGTWHINCHSRMSQRPNTQILTLCEQLLHCQITYPQKHHSFPLTIVSTPPTPPTPAPKTVHIQSQESSQFISSVMLNCILWGERIQIICNKPIVSETYVNMTLGVLGKFGVQTQVQDLGDEVRFVIQAKADRKCSNQIEIELDLSSFSYPYALAQIFGAEPPKLPSDSCQGDTQFYTYCKELSPNQPHTPSKPMTGLQSTVTEPLNFSSCTDTFMTMCALVSALRSRVQIGDIANQRVKECNRIFYTAFNLGMLGVGVKETPQGIMVDATEVDYENQLKNKTTVLITQQDHRLAMSFAILSVYLSCVCESATFIIDDKNAVNKTFPLFWQYLADVGVTFQIVQGLGQDNHHKHQSKGQIPKSLREDLLVVVGNRGSGKSTLSRTLSRELGRQLIDTDSLITQHIQQQHSLTSIRQFVEQKGWAKFREIEHNVLKEALALKQAVVCVGGGVVDWQPSLKLLREAKDIQKIYIEKDYSDLDIELNESRPALPNFHSLFKERSPKYSQISNTIITCPASTPKVSNYQHLQQELGRALWGRTGKNLKPGYILCYGNIHGQHAHPHAHPEVDPEEVGELAGVEIRVDLVAQKVLESMPGCTREDVLMHCRKQISQFRQRNPVLRTVPWIGTLRTTDQLGKHSPSSPSDYFDWLQQLEKLPFDYIDCEYRLWRQAGSPSVGGYSQSALYSYHGSDVEVVNQLLAKKPTNSDLLKVCFTGDMKTWEANKSVWQRKSDICLNLNYPISRTENKYKMIAPLCGGPINIPNIKQFKALLRLKKFFK